MPDELAAMLFRTSAPKVEASAAVTVTVALSLLPVTAWGHTHCVWSSLAI
jgi:hypothetical protein